jgi:RNA polymerase sigma-70 factor (ECF subfamily)
LATSSDWIPWISRAKQGDEDAFERLYRATRPRLHNAVVHLVGEDQAREIVQRAFVRAWERLPDLEEDAAFAGWLRRIAVNLVRDQWRSRKPHDEIPGDDELGALRENSPDPSVQVEGLQNAEHLRKAVSALPEIFREAVVLHYLDGFPVDEVSRILDVPRGTVLSRLARGRARLRRILSSIREVTP